VLPRLERPDLCRDGAPPLRVRVRYTRAEVSGRASLHSNTITLRLNEHMVPKDKLAKIINHELAHTRGLTHAQMLGSNLYCWLPGWEKHFTWAVELPLDRKPSKLRTEGSEGWIAWMSHLKKLLNIVKLS